MPHLANAFKYAFAIVVVLFGTFSPDLYDVSDITATHVVFILIVATSTLYTYSWDVFKCASDKHQVDVADRCALCVPEIGA